MNGEEISGLFSTVVGVKQGGVLSPKLFNIYVEDMIEMVEKNGVGVEIGSFRIDIILYADDIILISNNKMGLKNSLKIVEDYGKANDIKYNPTKTVYMIFNRGIDRTRKEQREDIWQGELELDGLTISRVNMMKYLGIEITDSMASTEHMTKQIRKYMGCVVKFKSLDFYSNSLNPYTKAQLYKTYLRPILMYGFENFVWGKMNMNQIKRLEGNTIKSMLGVPSRCRTSDLLESLNIDVTIDYINSLKLGFISRLMENKLTEEIMKESYRLGSGIMSRIQLERLVECDVNDYTFRELAEAIKERLVLNMQDKKRRKKEPKNDKIRKLRRIYSNNNREAIPNQIFELIRFDAA